MKSNDWSGDDQPEFHDYSGENSDPPEQGEIPDTAITAPDTEDGGTPAEQPLVFEPLDNTTLHDMAPAERAAVAASVGTFLGAHGRPYSQEFEEVKEVGVERITETVVETGSTCNIPARALREVGSGYDNVQLTENNANSLHPHLIGVVASRMVEATVDTYDPTSDEVNGRQETQGLELKVVSFRDTGNDELDVKSEAVLTAPFPPRTYIVPLVDESSGEAVIGVVRERPQQDSGTPTLNVSELQTIMHAVDRVRADPDAYAGEVPIMDEAKIFLNGQEITTSEGAEAQTGLVGLSDDEQAELFTALEQAADSGEPYQDRVPVWNESGFSDVSIIVGNHAYPSVQEIEQAGLTGYMQAEVESSDTVEGGHSHYELRASLIAEEQAALEVPTRDGLPMRTEEAVQVVKQVVFVTENVGANDEIKYMNVRTAVHIPYVGNRLVNFVADGPGLSPAEAQGLLRLARILRDRQHPGEA